MVRSDAALMVLQFDAAALTLLAVSPQGAGFRVERNAACPVEGPLSAGQLRAFAAQQGISSDTLYTVLPRHEVTLRILTLPAREPDEIASMVNLTAAEFVPYPRESLVIRHHLLDVLPSGESRVLLVLAHEDVIENHVALLGAAGLEPRQIFLSTACIHAAMAASPDVPSGRFAVVHAGVASVEVAVLEEGVLQFSRGAAHGGAWDLSTMHDRETLGYEVRDALAAYRRERDDGLGVSMVYVSAERADVAGLVTLLGEVTEKPCQRASAANGLVVEGAPDQISLVGLGAALAATGRAPMNIGLLPESMVRNRTLRTVRRQVVRVSALAALVLAVLVAWFAQAAIQRVILLRELEAQADALAPMAGGVAAKERGLQLISRQVARDGGFLELLSAVATAAPATEFNITRITYDREEGMNIWGRARTRDRVLSEFLGNLRGMAEGGLAMLARAHSQYETAAQERGEPVYNYHVTVPALPEEVPDASPAAAQ